MTINDKLKSAIKRQGFTISSVASKMRNERSGEIGISQPAMSDMLKGNIPFSRVEEIASIIGLSIIDIIQEDDDTCAQSIACPYCGRKIRISLMVERDEPQFAQTVRRKAKDTCRDCYDGTKYRYMNPRTQEERMAILELQNSPGDDGMVRVLNTNPIDSDSSEVFEVEFDRLTSI